MPDSLPIQPDTAETIAYLASVSAHLNSTIAHLETLIAKAWCFQPGDRVLVMTRVGFASPFSDETICGKEVTLDRPAPAKTMEGGIHWRVKEYPHLVVPESSLRPLRAKP